MTSTVRRPAHPATLAAQALGPVDERTGLSCRGSSRRRRSSASRARPHLCAGRQPNLRPGREAADRLGGGRRPLLFASGMAAATAVFQALEPGDHVVTPRVMYWSLRNWLLDLRHATGASRSTSSIPTDRTHSRAAIRPGTTQADLDRDAGQPAVGRHRHRRARRRSPTRPAPCSPSISTVGHAGADAADRARRRHRHAFGDQVPERPFRRGRGHAGQRARDDALWQRTSRSARSSGAILGSSRPGC